MQVTYSDLEEDMFKEIPNTAFFHQKSVFHTIFKIAHFTKCGQAIIHHYRKGWLS
jgi:hypothetical protein